MTLATILLRRQTSHFEKNDFGDSSGQPFSVFSMAAEGEDNKMAGRWQKDTEGILISVGPCAMMIHLRI